MSELDLSAGSMGWFSNPETIMHFQKTGMMDVFNKLRSAGNVGGLSDVIHMQQGTGGYGKLTNDQIRVVVNIEGSLIGSMPADVIEEVRVGLIEAQNSGKQLVVAQQCQLLALKSQSGSQAVHLSERHLFLVIH